MFLTQLKFIFMISLIFAIHLSAQTKTIAFAQDTMANDFRKAQVNEVKKAASKNPDFRFVYSDAKGQTSLLIHHIDQFIEQKADLIVVGTNDEKAVVPIVAKAYHAGIPIIILDRGIQGKEYTTFINSDNIKIGSIGADYIAKRLNGKGKVLLFEGLQKADVTQLRTKGFMDQMKQHKGISVIKRTGNYLRKDAIIEMEKLIESGEQIDAIFAESDSMLSGARSAMERHGINPSSVISVGCDYTSEAREAIRKGTQTGSVLFPLGGSKTIETTQNIFRGQKVPKHKIIPVKHITAKNVKQETPIF